MATQYSHHRRARKANTIVITRLLGSPSLPGYEPQRVFEEHI